MTTAYISAATNRFPRAADISDASIVAFGSSNLIAFWDPTSDRGVFAKLVGHEETVTCVRFISHDVLVTADEKGVVRCWRKSASEWTEAAKTQAHSHAIASLSSLGSSIVTTSSDGTVQLWEISSDAAELRKVQAFSLSGKYALSLALAKLPHSNVEILAIGTTDRNIHIWTRSSDCFVPSAVLQGHEDWVKCLAFVEDGEQTLVLASGSQDATIRLWKIEPMAKRQESQSSDPLADELLDAFEASLGDLADAEEGGRQISLKRHIVTVKQDESNSSQYSITFDALLIGHEAGVTSLSWRTISKESTLLSTSTDSSLILWSPSTIQAAETTIWVSQQRFGDVGGQRLGGFVGGLWVQGGSEALAWGWSGGWRRWRRTEESWSEISAITGHRGPIKSLDWSPNGEYLISTGLDQTTRIHGPVRGVDGRTSWHELSRPQVHGYDLLGVVFLDALKFVSIADEKVARVFEAPGVFVDLIENLGIASFSKQTRPVAASVPPLGLSNKAVSDVVTPASGSSNISRAPFEGELAATTLWPEIEKVFGHGYEVLSSFSSAFFVFTTFQSMSLAVSNSRKLIATACKASTAEHAVVRVYDTERWQPVGEPLRGHTLTVTRIAFSPDDRFILSVSRDRSWRLFEGNVDNGYTPVAADKSHGRIIWDCAWAQEENIFATASRDKTVKIWQQSEDEQARWIAVETLKLNEAATAVDFSPLDANNRRYLAIGLENGALLVYVQQDKQWSLHCSNSGHVAAIHRLSWRPRNSEEMELASCSEDGTLMIVQIAIKYV
ncbi:hypothetical protein MIND_00697100 [Mycena indigotica]|uniref:Elongator complex protein 2 n=1 Tax=Mycena indigotica TaxID=2126181 RepID=A0A8H6SM21_9AGAR|nr:uncharacterized protein MIND_00697100 [Mycena indigotica]KAF7301320.1 hypothetical protein MIND_00697100 [Mycena indigotica]